MLLGKLTLANKNMNYHLMIDSVFTDDFISDAETVSFEKNEYVIDGVKSETTKSKNEKIIFVQSIKYCLRNLLTTIELKDRVYVHWLKSEYYDFILPLNKKTAVSVFLRLPSSIDSTVLLTRKPTHTPLFANAINVKNSSVIQLALVRDINEPSFKNLLFKAKKN